MRYGKTNAWYICINVFMSKNLLNHKFNFSWLRSKSYFAIDGNPPTKYSMLPSVGKPWPMPFSYHSTDDAYLLDLNSLQFTATKHSCHILDFSIKRLRINLMGQSLFGANKPPAWSNQTYPVLHGVHIHVVNPCAKYPSLESIESCKCIYCSLMQVFHGCFMRVSHTSTVVAL